MKKILFFTIAAAALFSVSGCEKEIESYSGDRGIYFSVRWGNAYEESRWPYWSYSNFDFVQYVDNTVIAGVKVMITDVAVPYDREFTYEIDAAATTARAGVDYEVPDGVGIIPAGKVEGYATVTLNRTPEMETETVVVSLRLVANENFGLVFTTLIQPSGFNGTNLEIEEVVDASKHQLRIKDVLVKPKEWIGGLDGTTGAEFNLLGEFSPKKIKLLYELYDLTYADFMDSSVMTYGYMGVLGRRFGIYLTEQYRTGAPLVEDDGRLMWATGCKWSSYPGVPWDGTINPDYF